MAGKKIHLHTIGCQMNQSDSERLAGFLSVRGGQIVSRASEARYIIVNTCGVRQSAEDRAFGLAHQWRDSRPGIKIILTGCLAGRIDLRGKIAATFDFSFKIGDMEKLASFLGFKNIRFPRIKNTNVDYLRINPCYHDQVRAFVPIGNGCNNFCSYCVVPYARGQENWRPADEIITEARTLISHGCREITLIAQNVNSYKSFLKTKKGREPVDFSRLLRRLDSLPGNFWIRFATSHPKDLDAKLIETMADCEKVCEHLHLPAQAGDDEILRRMNRAYTIEHYKNLISRWRAAFRHSRLKKDWPTAVTTDLIVGFPSEKRQQFTNTLKLVRVVKFDQVYRARYSPRPGTAASVWPDNVPMAEKKRRGKILGAEVKKIALAINQAYVGKVLPVLVVGQNRHQEYYGLTRTNKKIILLESRCPPRSGEFYDARIVAAREFSLAGKIKKPASN